MGKAMYELREMLNDELTKISKSGDLTASKLDLVDKLTHSIKSIDTICAMEEYSDDYEDGYSMNDGGNSYARGRGRNARRDSMGRYSREGGNSYRGGNSYEGGSSYRGRGGYSRRDYSREDGAKEDAMQKLHELMNETSDSRVRMAIQKAMDEMQ